MKRFKVERIRNNISRLRTLQLPKSVFHSAHKVSYLYNETIDSCVIICDTERRLFQQIVATDSYYGSKNVQFDTVMVQSDILNEAADTVGTDRVIWFSCVIVPITVDL